MTLGTQSMIQKIALRFLLIPSLLFTLSCTENDPIKIGFIGGLSGRVADLGTAGRNGFTLAIEEQNALGGLNGQLIEVIYKDDQQNRQLVQTLVDELIQEDVDAIIGPMTSAMAMATIDQVNRAQKLMMSCTATTDQLTGLDDSFMRPISSNKIHASQAGEFIARHQPAANRAVAIIDLGNEAYTRNWLKGFQQSYEENGGKLLLTQTFISTEDTPFAGIAKNVLKANPNLIVLAVNSVDAALLIKQIKQTKPDIAITVSAWAGTERLLQLGGRYVENIYVPQYIDSSSTAPRYIQFQREFKNRFQNAPGFPGLFCYEATRIVLKGLSNKGETQSLKHTLLKTATFQGIQGPLTLDQYGDGESTTFMTQIKQGQFIVVEKNNGLK